MSGKPLIGITLDIEGEYLRLKQQYAYAIHKAGGLPLMIPPEIDAREAAEILDGLLIPGGDDIDPSYYSESSHPSVRPVRKERTGFEISLLKTIMELKKPVLGICYGMQLINIALGGNLHQDIETQLSNTLDHRSGTHKIKILKTHVSVAFNSAFSLQTSDFVVNSSHHQAVKTLGQGLVAGAWSDDNIIEAFYMPDYPFLLGVQWHPERMEDELSRNLFNKFTESAHADK